MEILTTALICLCIIGVLPFVFVGLCYVAVCVFQQIPWDGKLINERLNKRLEHGMKFSGGTAISLVGVGKGSQLLDSTPETTLILACLAIIGLYSFSLARMGDQGFAARLFTCIGIITTLSIMGISSFHFFCPSLFNYLIVFLAVAYVILMLSLAFISIPAKKNNNNSASEGSDEIEQQVNQNEVELAEDKPRPYLSKFADDCVLISITTGIGIIAVGSWGDKLKLVPEMLGVLAISNFMAFTLLTGAQIVEQGLIFEILTIFGSVGAVSVANGAVIFAIAPGYEVHAFYTTFLEFVIWWQWDIFEKIIDKCIKKKAE